MAENFKVYKDSGLVQEMDPAAEAFDIGNGESPKQFQFWFGSTDAALKVQANSNPGTDQITVSVGDSNPGSGHETTAVKLATTQAGLATATAGAALDLGTVINGGVGNAAVVWTEVTDATGGTVSSAELYPALNELLESPV